MRNATVGGLLPFLVLAHPTPAAAQEGRPFRSEIDAYLECINRQVLRHQKKVGHKVDNATAVIQACSAARSRLRIASQDAPDVEELIRGVEAHLGKRERVVDKSKE